MCGWVLAPHTFCAKNGVHCLVSFFSHLADLGGCSTSVHKVHKDSVTHQYTPSPIFISDKKVCAFRKPASNSKYPLAPDGPECSAED